MTDLEVWRDGVLVGRLTERRGRMTFAYEGPAAPKVSVSMPARSKGYAEKVARPFFQGLLPEGEIRLMIASDRGLGNFGGEDLDLLAELGGDSAGALVIVASGEVPPAPSRGRLVAVTDVEVGALLRDLPANPLGLDGAGSLSLPGVQPKLLLAGEPGHWSMPSRSTPSTHLLKPPTARLPASSVHNEAFCMVFAANLGLAAAETSVGEFDGVPALISTRYDRFANADGTTGRIHQEDGCQALSVLTAHAPVRKYEASGSGVSLRAIAAVLDRWAERGSLSDLLGQVVLNVIVGNSDFHAKNVSFLHPSADVVKLAPAYDVMNTTSYIGDATRAGVTTTMAMRIGGATDLHAVTMDDVVAEASGWAITKPDIDATITRILDRVPGALAASLESVPGVDPGIFAEIERRSEAARSWRPEGRPRRVAGR